MSRTLAERGIRDGVGRLYQQMAQRGELIQTGGRAVDLPKLIAAGLDRFGRPSAIAADRWRESELRDALQAARVPVTRLVERGQGFKDGGEDLRLFRRAALEGRIAPVESLLMRSAMAEAADCHGPGRELQAHQDGCRRAPYASPRRCCSCCDPCRISRHAEERDTAPGAAVPGDCHFVSRHHLRMKTVRWRKLRRRIFDRANWRCEACGLAGGPFECDHKRPLKRGGDPWDTDNLQCLCVDCHRIKTAMEGTRRRRTPAVRAWRKLVAELM